LAEKLEELAPELEARRKRGWVFAVATVVSTVCATIWAQSISDGDDLRTTITLIAFGAVGLFVVNHRVARSQQQLIMSLLVKAHDLHYQQNAKSFLKELPPRLLPRAMSRSAKDCISGSINDRQIKMAEVRIGNGGKQHQTLFHGIVLRFQNLSELPAFFIAPKNKTGGWIGRINVIGLIEADTIVSQSGKVYGVWLSKNGFAKQDLALSSVLDILTSLETQVGAGVSLFSATSNGEKMYLALNHNRVLFQIGGLFARVRIHNQNMMTAANAHADRKTLGHLS
jgi:hypothetical protein